MSMQRLAATLREAGPTTTLRQGVVAAVNADSTVDVTIAGSSVTVAGVRYASHVPVRPDAAVWIAVTGSDLFVIGTLAPIGPPYCRVRRAGNQTIPNDGSYAVDFTASPAELVDPTGMFDAADSDALTIQVPGLYLLEFQCAFAVNGTGYRQVSFDVDGVAVVHDRRVPDPTLPTRFTLTHVQALASGNVVVAIVRQTSGGDLALYGVNVHEAALTVAYLGPAE